MTHAGFLIISAIFLTSLPLAAETSLDALEQDLKEIKQENESNSSSTMVTFLSSLDSASRSPDAALDLYEKAGGEMPLPTRVQTLYEHETPDEKADRLAQDAANTTNLAYVAQVHCGLMRFAFLLLQSPDAPGLKNDWVAWLKNTATLYPQLEKPAAATPQLKDPRMLFLPHTQSELKDVPVSASVISSYLGFRGWGTKEQGKWRVTDLPSLYRLQVLEPLRSPIVPEVLPAWDSYILMRQTDEPDRYRWEQEDAPALQFERGADDFALKPSTEKLTVLVTLMKAHPNHPQTADWLTRMQKMLKSYRQQKGSAPDDSPSGDTPALTSTPPPTDSASTNVTPSPAPP